MEQAQLIITYHLHTTVLTDVTLSNHKSYFYMQNVLFEIIFAILKSLIQLVICNTALCKYHTVL